MPNSGYITKKPVSISIPKQFKCNSGGVTDILAATTRPSREPKHGFDGGKFILQSRATKKTVQPGSAQTITEGEDIKLPLSIYHDDR